MSSIDSDMFNHTTSRLANVADKQKTAPVD
jgi:hypothetical protein